MIRRYALLFVLVLVAVILYVHRSAPTGQPVPAAQRVAYTVLDKWEIPNGGWGKKILISPNDTTHARLVLLANELWQDTKDDRNAFISVFSDRKAAAMMSQNEEHWTKKQAKFYDQHFVADYTRNINTGYHKMMVALDNSEIEPEK